MSPLRARACSLLLSCAALGVTAAQAQTTYYVDQNHPAARDTNPGSASAPWRSIQQAAQVLEPGDTVLVASGVYTELYTGYPNSALGAIKPQRSGTVEAPITYAAAPGASVVIDQQGAGPGFYIFKKDHLVIRGFEIRNARMGGVWVAVDGARGIQVLDNHIHHVDGQAGANVGAVKLDGCSQCVVQGNRLHDVTVGGQRKLNSAGLHSFDMEDTLIEDNVVFDVHTGVYHKRSTGGPGVQVRNNRICRVTNGVLYSVAGGGDPAHRNQAVVGNDIVGCEIGVKATVWETGSQSRGLVVHHNAIRECAEGLFMQGYSELDIAGNLFATHRYALSTLHTGGREVALNHSDGNLYAPDGDFLLDRWGASRRHSGLSAWQNATGWDRLSQAADYAAHGPHAAADPDCDADGDNDGVRDSVELARGGNPLDASDGGGPDAPSQAVPAAPRPTNPTPTPTPAPTRAPTPTPAPSSAPAPTGQAQPAPAEPAPAEPTPAPEYVLRVSTEAARTPARALAGAQVRGDLFVFLEAPASLERVEFLLNGRLLKTERTAPYDLAGGSVERARAFDSTTLADGQHRLRARVWAGDGSQSTVEASFVVANTQAPADTVRPTVRLTTPAAGQALSGVVTLAAVAEDAGGIAHVSFRANGAFVGRVHQAPYTLRWDTREAADGSVEIIAVARDVAGNGRRQLRSVQVRNAPVSTPTPTPTPALALQLSPRPDRKAPVALAGRRVRDDIYVFLAAESAVEQVDFLLNGERVKTERQAPFDLAGGSVSQARALDTRTLADGRYTLEARVLRADGQRQRVQAQFDIANATPPPDTTRPTLRFRAPPAGEPLSGSHLLVARAEDDRGVVRVQFLLNGAVLVERTQAPYRLQWDSRSVADGEHVLAVRAFDAAGNSMRRARRVTVANNTASASDPGRECAERANDPALIFCDDFEDADLESRYFDVDRADGDLTVSSADALGGQRSLRSQYRQGRVNNGNVKLSFGRSPLGVSRIAADENIDEVYWRFYVKLDADWEGQARKLTRATMFTSSNWGQGMITHLWEGEGDTLGLDPVSLINAQDRAQADRYNDWGEMRWLGKTNGHSPVYAAAEVGQWRCVEVHTRLNSLGRADGEVAFWVDGALESRSSGLDLRGRYEDYGINAIFLENYWNGGAARDQARYIDNFVVSRERVGCLSGAGH